MPGHIKLVKGAVDPDPTEFLLPSMDMKKEDQSKPYEPKQSIWAPDPKTGGYREGLLTSGDITSIGAEGADLTTKLSVTVGHEKFTYTQKEIGRVSWGLAMKIVFWLDMDSLFAPGQPSKV